VKDVTEKMENPLYRDETGKKNRQKGGTHIKQATGKRLSKEKIARNVCT
jgi:hypothetical protein